MPEWITAALCLYEENKTLAGFLVGASTTGAGWVFAFVRYRQQMKDKAHALHLETLQLAADTVRLATNVLNKTEAARRDLMRKGSYIPLSVIADFQHGIDSLMRPNLENMKELYDAASAAEGLSLKEIKAFHLRVLKQKQLMDVVLQSVEGKIASVAEAPAFPSFLTREMILPSVPKR